MSFYLYDEPLRLYLHYTIRWVLKTYNLYSCGCIFVVEVTWTELTGDYLAFSGTIKPARWYRHLRQDFFLIYGSCNRVFLKSMREKPIFSMKRYRLPSSCIRQPCLLPRSDAQRPLTVPPAETEYHIVVYHITPSSATANTTATTLYTVATMAINIMLYSGIQRLCVLTRAMGSCMVNNCMVSAMKCISDQVLVIRSVKSLSSCISLKRDTHLLYLCKQQSRKKWLNYGRLQFPSTNQPQGCQPPMTSNIENWRWRDYKWRHLWKKKKTRKKEVVGIVTFDLIGLLPTNHSIAYITMAYRSLWGNVRC